MNCAIINNNIDEDGGGIQCAVFSSPLIINCTIAGNSSNERGGGLDVLDGSSPVLKNCILWGNSSATEGDQIGITDWDNPSSVTISYSDVQGGQVAVFIRPECHDCALNWGLGNIDANPQFAADNYHLTPSSPCIDTGTTVGAPDDDIDGEVRPCGDGLDIGADESVGTCTYDLPVTHGAFHIVC